MNTLPLYLAALCLIPLIVGLIVFRAEQTTNTQRRAADVESARMSAERKADKAVFAYTHPDTATAKARRREQLFRKGQTK